MTQLAGSAPAELSERLPPHSVEAEMCVLASMMLDAGAIATVVESIAADAFYLVDHRILFDLMVELFRRNRPVDAMILREELAKRKLLDEVGGVDYLAQLLDSVPSAAHAAHYASIVREKHLLRQLIAAGHEILRDAYAPHEQAETVVEKAEKTIFAIAEKKVRGQAVALETVLHEVYDRIEDRGQRGVLTDFHELDDMLNGLQNGDLIIVAARPSMGKTALAMNIVENVAANHRLPVAVFSLEMSRQQLAQRLLCSRAGIDAQRVRRGMLNAQEYQKLAAVVVELSKAPIFVDDSASITALELRAKARRLRTQHQIGLIMIDYLQLIDNPGPDSRQQQISEISRGLKAVAREMEIPIIALSQLNRLSEGREGHRPRMSDLRESGSIEQDADVVMLLHRDDYYRNGEPDFMPDNIAEVIVAKQRNGPTGTVKLTFDTRTTTFRNLAAQIDPV